MLAVAVGAILVVPMSVPLADSAGRIYSRCINACNAARQACSARCPGECSAMFPNDVAARSACLNQCKDTCITEEKECKDRCQAIKKGESPSEP